MKNINDLLNNNIIETINRGKEELKKIKNEFQKNINESLPMVEIKIKEIDDNLTQFFQNLSIKWNSFNYTLVIKNYYDDSQIIETINEIYYDTSIIW